MMKKNIWYTIGLYKDGVCVDPLRVFQLPKDDLVMLFVERFTAIFAEHLKDITPEGHYIAFDYEGRK
jgi:hypothetical protein